MNGWALKAIAFLFLIGVFGCDSAPAQQTTVQSEKQESDKGSEQKKESGAKSDDQQSDSTTNSSDASDKKGSKPIPLFDGKTLNGWESISFGGEGDIEVSDGEIRMQFGDPLTGICVTDDVQLPKTNYIISLKAMKRDGNDFFCGLTFPVGDSFCSLIVGGWAGTVVGLSNLDDRDASDNGTRVVRKFERNQWYDIKVQVTPERITAWIDNEKLVDESIVDRKVSIRGDVISTTPLGITSFITESALKDISIQKITQ